MRPEKTQVHVLLVSAQAAPNLLPALDPDLKPDEAVLIVTAKMRPRADALESVLKETGIRTTRVPLDNEHDYAAIEAALMKVAGEREGQRIALNVTGGTKLMALAAQSVAQAWNWPVFYVDMDTDEVIWLAGERGRQPLARQLRLRHYLQGYGFTVENGIQRPQPRSHHNTLMQTLVTQIGSLETPLSQLNWLAQQAEDAGRLEAALTAQQQDSRSLEALLRNFEAAGVARVTDDKVVFADTDARAFAKGGWLEHFVYRAVEAQSGRLGIRDKAANLVVMDALGVKNELDVAFLARNRLFVIECKTARMDKPEAPKANDTLFKLAEICRRVGGLGTQGMLASYRRVRESEKRLAHALGIELVCGPELARLEERLKTWVRP